MNFLKDNYTAEENFYEDLARYSYEVLKGRRFEVLAWSKKDQELCSVYSISSKEALNIPVSEDMVELLKKEQYLTTNESYPGFFFLLGDNQTDTFFIHIRFDAHFKKENFPFTQFLSTIQVSFLKTHFYSMERKLKGLVYQDDVTGLFNQRKLYSDLNEAIDSYEKKQIPFSVLFIDIDHFKSVNDGHGHLIGSELLIKIGQRIVESVRDCDLVYRYGGDEFVVVVPNIEEKAALNIGERILSNIKSKNFIVANGIEKSISVSVGVCAYKDSSAKGILELADNLMYQAKKEGRGMVKSLTI